MLPLVDIYAQILTHVQAPALQASCEATLQTQIENVKNHTTEVHGALQRLLEVQEAASKLDVVYSDHVMTLVQDVAREQERLQRVLHQLGGLKSTTQPSKAPKPASPPKEPNPQETTKDDSVTIATKRTHDTMQESNKPARKPSVVTSGSDSSSSSSSSSEESDYDDDNSSSQPKQLTGSSPKRMKVVTPEPAAPTESGASVPKYQATLQWSDRCLKLAKEIGRLPPKERFERYERELLGVTHRLLTDAANIPPQQVQENDSKAMAIMERIRQVVEVAVSIGTSADRKITCENRNSMVDLLQSVRRVKTAHALMAHRLDWSLKRLEEFTYIVAAVEKEASWTRCLRLAREVEAISNLKERSGRLHELLHAVSSVLSQYFAPHQKSMKLSNERLNATVSSIQITVRCILQDPTPLTKETKKRYQTLLSNIERASNHAHALHTRLKDPCRQLEAFIGSTGISTTPSKKETKETKETKEPKGTKETREIKETKETKEPKSDDVRPRLKAALDEIDSWEQNVFALKQFDAVMQEVEGILQIPLSRSNQKLVLKCIRHLQERVPAIKKLQHQAKRDQVLRQWHDQLLSLD